MGVAGLHCGQAFVEAVRWSQHTELVAICDTSPAAPEQRGPVFGEVTQFTEYERRLDLVIISSPVHVHMPQAIAALDRGMHVFSGVPAAISPEQCAELVKAVRRARGRYIMAENGCYTEPHMVAEVLA